MKYVIRMETKGGEVKYIHQKLNEFSLVDTVGESTLYPTEESVRAGFAMAFLFFFQKIELKEMYDISFGLYPVTGGRSRKLS